MFFTGGGRCTLCSVRHQTWWTRKPVLRIDSRLHLTFLSLSLLFAWNRYSFCCPSYRMHYNAEERIDFRQVIEKACDALEAGHFFVL